MCISMNCLLLFLSHEVYVWTETRMTRFALFEHGQVMFRMALQKIICWREAKHGTKPIPKTIACKKQEVAVVPTGNVMCDFPWKRIPEHYSKFP